MAIVPASLSKLASYSKKLKSLDNYLDALNETGKLADNAVLQREVNRVGQKITAFYGNAVKDKPSDVTLVDIDKVFQKFKKLQETVGIVKGPK